MRKIKIEGGHADCANKQVSRQTDRQMWNRQMKMHQTNKLSLTMENNDIDDAIEVPIITWKGANRRRQQEQQQHDM